MRFLELCSQCFENDDCIWPLVYFVMLVGVGIWALIHIYATTEPSTETHSDFVGKRIAQWAVVAFCFGFAFYLGGEVFSHWPGATKNEKFNEILERNVRGLRMNLKETEVVAMMETKYREEVRKLCGKLPDPTLTKKGTVSFPSDRLPASWLQSQPKGANQKLLAEYWDLKKKIESYRPALRRIEQLVRFKKSCQKGKGP